MKFEVQQKLSNALGRAGRLTTAHGVIETPAFVAVGTKATVKALTPEQIKETGTQVVLGNTYHLYLEPGEGIIKQAGGLGKFMGWDGPTMTDSGGFQVFSLGAAFGEKTSKVSKGSVIPALPPLTPRELPSGRGAGESTPLAKIDEDGVTFKSYKDGSSHRFTPEKSIEIQHDIGADIIFAFDECTSPNASYEYQKEAMSRTHRWAERSLQRHNQLSANSHELADRGAPALFGIVQGGRFEDLRKESASVIGGMRLTPSERSDFSGPAPWPQSGFSGPAPWPQSGFSGPAPWPQSGFSGPAPWPQSGFSGPAPSERSDFSGFDGFGIGGSFDKEDMGSAVRWVNELLPEEKPRHLLGIGDPLDLFEAVENGCDLFDCVTPTRQARTGSLYTNHGKFNIENTKYRTDFAPIEVGCQCSTCKNFTRAYLSHLFRSNEILSNTLATIHNVYFIVELVKKMRQSILAGTFSQFRETFSLNYRT